MKVIQQLRAMPTRDGDGVNIMRIADFQRLALDPYLMLDEIRSDDAKDYIGGFPPHPHRGMETFTYIRKGGFEHRDQLGNVRAIRAGKVQWMSTGRGVIHSEMPLADADNGLHGFQIWLNMPAKDKMRHPQYQDSGTSDHPTLSDGHGQLYLLAGHWQFGNEAADAPLMGLAADAAIADMTLPAGKQSQIELSQYKLVALYLYQGQLLLPSGSHINAGSMLLLDPQYPLQLQAGTADCGMLLLAGNPIGEKVVQMGPFVMNTQAEIMQAINDYQSGQFGEIV
ncbi:pirin family protein [Shewanella yunxiaonensis]|uniref:Pirin family protein n=1 Tax=Shewanella yunxiaonensis TaxID=2829809 RepID=A0ABX7YR83_9GAMM|nr:pirin family protein [Shewanella yunxiaonensis]QUN05280.1 pirin family protein [Shewanella yunxiaonensis]